MKALWILPMLGTIGAVGLIAIMRGEINGAPQAAELYAMATASAVIPFVFVRTIEGLLSGVGSADDRKT